MLTEVNSNYLHPFSTSLEDNMIYSPCIFGSAPSRTVTVWYCTVVQPLLYALIFLDFLVLFVTVLLFSFHDSN